MAQLKQGAAGIRAKEIDRSGVSAQLPSGVPAGIIGTSLKGPAFVPVTFGSLDAFYAAFGRTDGEKFGPLAVSEWMRYATSVTYLRVLGIGDGKRRLLDGNTAGSVTSAGFVVGENLPNSDAGGVLAGNPYANSGSNSVPGRTYFLGCFMSESAGSTVFSSPGLQLSSAALPIVRGIVLAASGVILRLSASHEGVNSAPASTLIATNTFSSGSILGSVVLTRNNEARQEFTLLLNGHKGTDALYPNVITASFDMTAPNYFVNVLNSDPAQLNRAGHFLYANYDVHPVQAVVTGTGVVTAASGSGAATSTAAGREVCAFITTGSAARNVGTTTIPNYENFEDRFSHARTPWFISQRFGGSPQNLFRLHALDAGAGISTLFKVSIENIVASSDPADRFPSFDVVIRSYDDRDGELQPLEQWRGVDLDPGSSRYIARVIGDVNSYFDFDRSETSQKLVVEGSYENKSAYVRVEVSSAVDNEDVDPTAMPMGFRGHAHLVTSGSAPLTTATSTQISSTTTLKSAVSAPTPFRSKITAGSGSKEAVNSLLYWGVQFEHVASLDTPNASTLKNESIDSFAKYFPGFMTAVANFVAGDNAGTVDTAANGIMDSDRFARNVFSLENIRVVTASTGLADPAEWDQAVYVRSGDITADASAKTRRVQPSDFTSANKRFLKYTTFLQGGFDGVNTFDDDESRITNAAVDADMDNTNRGLINGPSVKAYTKAFSIMENPVNADVKLLAVPGIRNSTVTDAAVASIEDNERNAMFIMDIEQRDVEDERVESDEQIVSVDYTVQAFTDRALDTSYAAAYFPDVVVRDPTTDTNVVAPPSVAVLGAMALNDSIGHPWFAPAGFARGALATVQEARVRLSKDNMDDLANANINPLVAFPGNATAGTNPKGGVVVWGQKTLQAAASSLDRVNVRRLLIELRRQVRDVVQSVVFEPNRESTLSAITAAITPRFRRVQTLAGLERFKIVFDASTTTQNDILNNTIRGVIFVQPTKTLEFINISFIIQNNLGAVG